MARDMVEVRMRRIGSERLDVGKNISRTLVFGQWREGVFALPNFVRDLVTPARLKQPARGRRLGVVRAASK